MSSEHRQSQQELQQHLTDTVQALELSARAFDVGYEGEAKRLAAAIRILVHDTPHSTSLLGQLERKSRFYDTCMPRHPENTMTYNGITAMNLAGREVTYVALLDEVPSDSPPQWVSFDRWWNRVIFVDEAGRETTRRDLILAVANKDGGAHVDPVLDEKYASLSRRNSLAWRTSGPRGDSPLEGPEKSAVRQIAHEVLKSLNPEMPSMKPTFKGVVVMDVHTRATNKQPTIPRVGRNEPCPCGSGKKYKKCHGMA